jgi:RNA polymerase sigma-70 factor (ECF subfamily)
MEASVRAMAGPTIPELPLNVDNEREVVREWKRGNKRAYEILVRRYMSDAYLVAYGYVGNSEDARDLSQEAFVKVYQARARFDEERPFYPWLYRVLRNHCLNFLRRGRVEVSLDNEDAHLEIASPQPTALEDLESEERRRIVRAAVARLSDDHREIIVLKNFKDCSYKEIADILEIPIGTVMSRLFYARQALRALVEEIEGESMGRKQRGAF